MHAENMRHQAATYILERACARGGFCFYRLDEPSPRDTYFALAGLNLLNFLHSDEKTVGYLRSLQDENGSFGPLSRSYFAISALRLLGNPPRQDPGKAVRELMAPLLESHRPAREFPARRYRDLLRACALFPATGQAFDPAVVDQLDAALYRFAHPDGGFGINGSSLDETLAAAEALRIIKRPPAREGLIPFVRSCEDATLGFTGKPGTSLGYLEYLSSGVSLCASLDITPTYPDACRDSVRRCQQATGGFARAETGIATLENTFQALRALAHLGDGRYTP